MKNSIDTIRLIDQEINPYKKIERKVQIIISIKNLIRENANLGLVELKKKLEEYKLEIESNFDQKTVDLKNKILNTEQELKEISSKLKVFYDKADETEEDEFYQRLPKEVTESKEFQDLSIHEGMLREELFNLHENDEKNNSLNVTFLVKIEDFFNGVLEKKRLYTHLKEIYDKDPLTFMHNIRLSTGWNIYIDDVEKLQFSGLNINIIINQDRFQEIAKSRTTLGLHAGLSNINLIKHSENEKEAETTINHEENHTLEELFVPAPTDDREMIAMINERMVMIKKLRDLRAPAMLSNNIIKGLPGLIKNYTRFNASELIADLDSIEKGNIFTYLSYILSLANRLADLINKMESSDQRDEEIERVIKDGYESFKKSSAEFLVKLSNMFYVAKRIGKIEELKALFILFKTDNIGLIKNSMRNIDPMFDFYYEISPMIQAKHHIDFGLEGERFRSSFVGQMFAKRFRRSPAEEIKKEIRDRESDYDSILDLNPERTNEIIRTIERLKRKGIEIDLREDERESIRKSIQSFKYILFDDLCDGFIYRTDEDDGLNYKIISSLNKKDEIIKYHTDLKKIFDSIGKPELIKDIEECLYIPFIYQILKGVENQNFNNAKEYYEHWPFDKSILDEGLKSFLDEEYLKGFCNTIHKYNNGIGNIADIINETGVGEFLKGIGFKYEPEQREKEQIKST